MKNAYLGPQFSNDKIEKELKMNAVYKHYKDDEL